MPVVMIYELAGIVTLERFGEFVEQLDELGDGLL
jgi:hypothetical protein